MRELFWERYSLGELNKKEWEALCDGCGQCCLERYVGDDNKVTVYSIACPLLNIEQSRCTDYEKRLAKVPSCHQLTPQNVPEYSWLPQTCAYRVLDRGEPLPSWHPLLTGNRSQMRKEGVLVSGYAVPAKDVPRRKRSQYIIARWQL